MKKILSIFLSICMSLGVIMIFPSELQAKEIEIPVSLAYSNPYPEHDWINLGTIKLDPVQVNSAVSVRDAVYEVLSKFVGAFGGIINQMIIDAIKRTFGGKQTYTFYIKLTQYVSTDYMWHYYTYTCYSDSACTKPIATYTSTKWQDRYTKRQVEKLQEFLKNRMLYEKY